MIMDRDDACWIIKLSLLVVYNKIRVQNDYIAMVQGKWVIIN